MISKKPNAIFWRRNNTYTRSLGHRLQEARDTLKVASQRYTQGRLRKRAGSPIGTLQREIVAVWAQPSECLNGFGSR